MFLMECVSVTFRHTLLRSDSVGVVSGSPYSVPVLSLASGFTPSMSNSETSPYHSGSSDVTPNSFPHLRHNHYFFVITFPPSVSTPAMDYSPQECRTFREQNAAFIFIFYISDAIPFIFKYSKLVCFPQFEYRLSFPLLVFL
jgi:hypothetical protein